MNINHLLPTEIISEILSRLPTKSLLETKLVCKKWKNLIQHRSFPQMHLSRLDSTESGKSRHVFVDEFYKHLYYFEYDDNDDVIDDWNHDMDLQPVRTKFRVQTPFDKYFVIGSVNGLICVYKRVMSRKTLDIHNVEIYAQGPASIFNPVTREFILLPRIESRIEYIHLASGFGYVAATNEYKVVRIYMLKAERNFVEVEVYTVGSGNGWRNVGRFGFKFQAHTLETHCVFWNGALHWRDSQGGMVVVFDLAHEKFRDHIPAPPIMLVDEVGDKIERFVMIGVSSVGGFYYAVCQCGVGGLRFQVSEVWLLMAKNGDHVMKEQKENKSWGWSKVANLQQRELFRFTKGGTVLRYNQCTSQIFVLVKSCFQNYRACCAICRQVYPHKHSLISLKDLGEENVLVMEMDGNEYSDSD